MWFGFFGEERESALHFLCRNVSEKKLKFYFSTINYPSLPQGAPGVSISLVKSN
jgi:hypothetical protein